MANRSVPQAASAARNVVVATVFIVELPSGFPGASARQTNPAAPSGATILRMQNRQSAERRAPAGKTIQKGLFPIG